ncbi:MAG: hypothetical protein KF864_11320 [Phycisphaeraceae bacterium]|nr:hypothetical protein [Phycisphaeraceae bacterium]
MNPFIDMFLLLDRQARFKLTRLLKTPPLNNQGGMRRLPCSCLRAVVV